MIEWYNDNKDVSIYFDDMPLVKERYLTPFTPKQDKISISLYPFINKRDLLVTIFDHKKNTKYEFNIPKNYCYDGATIPQVLWCLVGSSSDNEFLIGALVHDWLCENHSCINNDRELSTRVLRALFISGGVSKSKSSFMCFFVDIFQRFCNW